MNKINKISNIIIDIFSSPILAFVLLTIGTFAQGLHTFYLTKLINPLTPLLANISSILLAIFFSFGLLFFSVKLGISKDKYGNKVYNTKHRNGNKIELPHEDIIKYSKTTLGFQIFEMFINNFYWVTKVIYIGNGKFDFNEIYLLIAALPLANILPIIMRYYAGEIYKSSLKDGKYNMLMENGTAYNNVNITKNN